MSTKNGFETPKLYIAPSSIHASPLYCLVVVISGFQQIDVIIDKKLTEISWIWICNLRPNLKMDDFSRLITSEKHCVQTSILSFFEKKMRMKKEIKLRSENQIK